MKYYPFPKFTDSLFSQHALSHIETEIEQIDVTNTQLYSKRLEKLSKLQQDALKLYGEFHPVARYLFSARADIPLPPSAQHALRQLRKAHAKFMKEQEVSAKGEDYRRRAKEAIENLKALRLEPDVDFDKTSALTFAKKLSEYARRSEQLFQMGQAVGTVLFAPPFAELNIVKKTRLFLERVTEIDPAVFAIVSRPRLALDRDFTLGPISKQLFENEYGVREWSDIAIHVSRVIQDAQARGLWKQEKEPTA